MGEVLNAASRIRAQQGRPPPPVPVQPSPPLARVYIHPTPAAPEVHRVAPPIEPHRPPPPLLHSVSPPHVTNAVLVERERIRREHAHHLSRAIEESNRLRNEHAGVVSRGTAEAARLRAAHDELLRRAARERARFDRQLAEANAAPVTATLSPPAGGGTRLLDLHMPRVLEEALLIALEKEQDPAKLRELARRLVSRFPSAASVFQARAVTLEAQTQAAPDPAPATASGY
jgi:hypothetical protein